MHAEVISIGDELTSGQRLDTNCQWLSQRLAELGVRTLYHTTVGDDLGANVAVFRNAIERADLIVATGGLGPTADDLTREALAKATKRGLVLDEASLQHIEGLFARRRGRPMPESNRVQAFFPAGSAIIFNPHGTAPGIDLEVPVEGTTPARVFCLPGVPAEMKEMWSASVAPAIEKMLGPDRKVIVQHAIRCFGVGESDLEAMLPDIIRRGRKPEVGITASKATLTLRIVAEGSSEAACRESMRETIETIYRCIGPIAFGTGEQEVHHAVLRLLAEQGQTLAIVDCGTGGLLGEWLGEEGTSAGVYRGGVNAKDDATAGIVLGVEASTTTAETLAAACRSRFQTDYALVIGEFPPAPPDARLPPSCALALASSEGVLKRTASLGAHPEIIVPRVAKTALNWLRLKLLGVDEAK